MAAKKSQKTKAAAGARSGAKAATSAGLKHGEICCVYCGTANRVRDTGLPAGGLERCTKCGRPPVEAYMLLTALNLNPFDDSNDCPSCGRTNSIHHAFCFGCGRKLGGG